MPIIIKKLDAGSYQLKVELAGFRSNTSPRLIDVADQFIELDSHLDEITKADSRYNHNHHSGSHYISTRNSGAFARVQDDDAEVEASREAGTER